MPRRPLVVAWAVNMQKRTADHAQHRCNDLLVTLGPSATKEDEHVGLW